MSSIFGERFQISTWGESHGTAVGVTIDGCPAGLSLDEEMIQKVLDRRKPGRGRYSTARKEADTVRICSGVFEGKTTGTPIALVVANKDHHSADYSNIRDVFRPGHGDYTYTEKYGVRDYRGGGRASARETVGRVAAGAVAMQILKEAGIEVRAYTRSVGPVEIGFIDPHESNDLNMPDPVAYIKAKTYAESCMKENDSAGGVCECVISGVPAGLGEPVFGKLDARLAEAMLSIGAAKGVEIGDGFAAAGRKGSENNDAFVSEDGTVRKETNHAGGILAGISDGADITCRVAFKPTPSIAREQKTVTTAGEETSVTIHGRHDPLVVPRACVVVEAMAALVICDALLLNLSSKMEYIKKIYG